jgi:hypothetical protein
MSEEDKALSLVGQINATYRELKEAQHSSVVKAITLGDLLVKAKEAVGHGKWADWLKKHCSEISHSTANVYMNLAKNSAKFEDPANSQRAVNSIVEKDLSIRAAIALLKTDAEKAEAEARRAARKAERDATKAAEEAAAKAANRSQDLATVLVDKAPDELLLAIGDKEKEDELFKQQLRSLTPSSVVDLLGEVWQVDQLRRLGEYITDHLKRKATPPIGPHPVQAEARAQ